MTTTEPEGTDALPRVLVPITIHFGVRYVVRTGLLRLMTAWCRPVLALSWDDPDLVAELEAEGVEVARLPDARVEAPVHGLVADLSTHFARRLASPSTPIDQARRHVDRDLAIRLRRRATWERSRLRTRRPGHEAALLARLADALPTATNLADNQAFLAHHRIDAVFSITPFAIQELVLLHAVHRAGLPVCTSILSFDNITTRPPLPIPFHRYLVWNRFNRDEILRGFPGTSPDQVALVGPAQFDFYADPSWVAPREAWRAERSVADDAPTVLYGAGPPSVSPHETQYLDHLCEAVDRGDLPADLRIVLRRHPMDRPDRWERFRDHPAVAFDDPGRLGTEAHRPGQVDMGRVQIVDLCSALAHTDVHISVSSTMTLDGAFYDKPQIGPAYDETPGRRFTRRAADLYRREHFVPIVASGGLELAHDRAQLVGLVRAGLDRPARRRAERRAMLEALCTYTDGACTERVATEVRRFLADHVPPAATTP
jgi:hypothetical protein